MATVMMAEKVTQYLFDNALIGIELYYKFYPYRDADYFTYWHSEGYIFLN